METFSPEEVNYYLRYGWRLLSEHVIPATEYEPPKTKFVMAYISTIEETKQIVKLTDLEQVNTYLQLGWKLIDKIVTSDHDEPRRSETIHFVLAWQLYGDPALPVDDAERLSREREIAAEIERELG
jgi:hypothetical protein